MLEEGILFTSLDQLQMDVWNSAPGVTVHADYIFTHSNGNRTTASLSVTPSTDRVINTVSTDLGVGFLTGVRVRADGVEPRRGQTYVRLSKIANISGTDRIIQQVANGYLAELRTLSYPPPLQESSVEGPGNIRSIVGTTPAVGQQVAEVVPTNAKWRVINAYARLTTSATAATRTVYWRRQVSGVTFAAIPAAASQGASLAYTYRLELTARASPLTPPNTLIIPVNEMILLQGETLSTFVDAMQGNDQWDTVRYTVEEWIQE